jgi:hypothetical protein
MRALIFVLILTVGLGLSASSAHAGPLPCIGLSGTPGFEICP